MNHSVMFVISLYSETDKVAVIIQMEQYVEVTENYQLKDKAFGPKIAEIRYVIHYTFLIGSQCL